LDEAISGRDLYNIVSGLEDGENSSPLNGGLDGTATELPGRANEELGLDQRRASRLIGAPLRGVTKARFEEVLVREFGGTAVDQMLPPGASVEGIPGFEPIDRGRLDLKSFELRNRGLFNEEYEGLAAARLSTTTCGNGGELAGDTGVEFDCGLTNGEVVTGI